MEPKVIINWEETSFTLQDLNDVFYAMNKNSSKICEEVDSISEDREKEKILEDLLGNI